MVLRTDVESFCASIDRALLMQGLAVQIRERYISFSVGQLLRHSTKRGGSFFEHKQGMSLGGPLSLLMGAFCLNELDIELQPSASVYVRLMDDIVVPAAPRWKRAKQSR